MKSHWNRMRMTNQCPLLRMIRPIRWFRLLLPVLVTRLELSRFHIFLHAFFPGKNNSCLNMLIHETQWTLCFPGCHRMSPPSRSPRVSLSTSSANVKRITVLSPHALFLSVLLLCHLPWTEAETCEQQGFWGAINA